MKKQKSLTKAIGYIRLGQHGAYDLRSAKDRSYKKNIDEEMLDYYDVKTFEENAGKKDKLVWAGNSFTGSSSVEAREVGKLLLDALRAGYEMHDYFLEVNLFSETKKGQESHSGFMEMVSDLVNEKGIPKTVLISDMKHLSDNEEKQRLLIQYLASKGITLIQLQREEETPVIRYRLQRGEEIPGIRYPYKVIANNLTSTISVEAIKTHAILTQCDKTIEYLGLAPEEVDTFIATGKRPVGRKSYHKDRPELVLKMKKLYRKRKGHKKPSYQDVADHLNASGDITFSGKPFSRQNVQKILEDPKTKLLARSKVDMEKIPQSIAFELEEFRFKFAKENPHLVGDAEVDGTFSKEFEKAKKEWKKNRKKK